MGRSGLEPATLGLKVCAEPLHELRLTETCWTPSDLERERFVESEHLEGARANAERIAGVAENSVPTARRWFKSEGEAPTERLRVVEELRRAVGQARQPPTAEGAGASGPFCGAPRSA